MSGAVDETGTYVRTPDGVGYIFDKEGDQCKIALVGRDEEVTHPAGALTLWVAEDGEPVAEDEDWPHGPAPVWS